MINAFNLKLFFPIWELNIDVDSLQFEWVGHIEVSPCSEFWTEVDLFFDVWLIVHRIGMEIILELVDVNC